MTTGAFSRNIGKLFPELKLVTDNLPLQKWSVLKSVILVIIYPKVDCVCLCNRLYDYSGIPCSGLPELRTVIIQTNKHGPNRLSV